MNCHKLRDEMKHKGLVQFVSDKMSEIEPHVDAVFRVLIATAIMVLMIIAIASMIGVMFFPQNNSTSYGFVLPPQCLDWKITSGNSGDIYWCKEEGNRWVTFKPAIQRGDSPTSNR
jgi:hypothetical protein